MIDLAQPSNIDAERQVLGAILSRADVLDEVTITGQDFYEIRHEQLFDVLRRQHSDGNPTDPLATLRPLEDNPIRGVDAAYLHELHGGLITAANADYYAGLVREAAELRAVQQAGVAMVQAGTGQAEAAKARARAILDGLDVRTSGTAVRVRDLYEPMVAAMESGVSGSSPTPWPEVDEKIQGMRPGEVITVGARTAVGKSVFGLNMAWHTAMRGEHSIVFSVEMSREKVMQRLTAAITRVPLDRVMSGKLIDAEWSRVSKAWDVIDSSPLYIDATSSLTASAVRATVRRIARQGKVGCVVVDYVQLMTADRRIENRQEAVSESSRALKILAGDLDVPLVMVSQLNRNVENRMDKRPMLADLRESGSLEQDSDVVLLLHRDEDKSPDVMTVGVAKNRNGPTAALRLKWEGHFQRVVSPALDKGSWQ